MTINFTNNAHAHAIRAAFANTKCEARQTGGGMEIRPLDANEFKRAIAAGGLSECRAANRLAGAFERDEKFYVGFAR